MTPELKPLAVLAARVEALTGPDRNIDAEIGALMGLRIVEEGHPLGRVCYDSKHQAIALPSYTRSLDAAMTLALPSWWFSASLPLSPDAYGYSREDLRKPRAAFEMLESPYIAAARAETLPLAIVAACLRGRAITPTQTQKGPHDE